MAADRVERAGGQLLERVDGGVEGAQLVDQRPRWAGRRRRAGPSGTSAATTFSCSCWSSWSRSSYSLLRATASCAASSSRSVTFGQGRGDHDRLAGQCCWTSRATPCSRSSEPMEPASNFITIMQNRPLLRALVARAPDSRTVGRASPTGARGP